MPIQDNSDGYSKNRRNTWLKVMIFIILIIMLPVIWYGVTNWNPPVPTPASTILVDKNVTIEAGQYLDFEFAFTSTMTATQIEGRFKVLKDDSSKIDVYILDDSNFENWKKDADYEAYLRIDGSSGDHISAYPPSGKYHLIYDNSASSLSVNIDTSVFLFYLP